MRFEWTEQEKEYFYRKAERQLRKNGIDFLSVDRDQFGVKGWKIRKRTIGAALISLTPYPYRCLTQEKKKMLENMDNWECTDKEVKSEESIGSRIYMHSRLIIGKPIRRQKKYEYKKCPKK